MNFGRRFAPSISNIEKDFIFMMQLQYQVSHDSIYWSLCWSVCGVIFCVPPDFNKLDNIERENNQN